MTMVECKVCGHKWIPRTDKPLSCPNCKNRKWNESKKEGKAKCLLKN
jgi:hypothetical protein